MAEDGVPEDVEDIVAVVGKGKGVDYGVVVDYWEGEDEAESEPGDCGEDSKVVWL